MNKLQKEMAVAFTIGILAGLLTDSVIKNKRLIKKLENESLKVSLYNEALHKAYDLLSPEDALKVYEWTKEKNEFYKIVHNRDV